MPLGLRTRVFKMVSLTGINDIEHFAHHSFKGLLTPWFCQILGGPHLHPECPGPLGPEVEQAPAVIPEHLQLGGPALRS